MHTHIAGSFHQRLLDGFESPPVPAAAAQDTAPGHRPGQPLGAHRLGGLLSPWAVLAAGPEGWSIRTRRMLAAFLTWKRWKGSVKGRQGEA